MGHGKRAARASTPGSAVDLQGRRRPSWGSGSSTFRCTPTPSVASSRPPGCQAQGFEEILAGLSEPEARFEASRCLSCGNCFECDNCYAACPEQAIVKLGKGRFYRVDDSLCTGCAVCFEQCPCHAIEMVPERGTEASTDPRLATPVPAAFKVRP